MWSSTILLLLTFSFLFLSAGCGTLENGRGWGQDTAYPIDFNRITRAARDALLDPYTLLPLAGAAVFAIDDFDVKVSNWAIEHNPIFGTEDTAADTSTTFKRILRVESYTTAALTPSGDDPKQWLFSKAKGFGVELLAVNATEATTTWLKHEIDRARPGEGSRTSMPSGHASTSASLMTLANRNLKYIDAVEDIRPVLVTGNTILGLGVGWARVEAGVHYPSDSLVGMALGNFLAAFIHDALMNLPQDNDVDIAFFPTEEGVGVALSYKF